MASTDKLNTYITKLESYIPQHEFTNPKVSKATIGWQVDHSLKVVNNVIEAMKISNPDEFKNNLSFLGKFFIKIGYFPRGKAKAPKHVKPPEIIKKVDIYAQVLEAKNKLANFESLNQNSYFKHPMFGHINKKRAPRFLETHTKHHLKIIEDMLGK